MSKLYQLQDLGVNRPGPEVKILDHKNKCMKHQFIRYKRQVAHELETIWSGRNHLTARDWPSSILKFEASYKSDGLVWTDTTPFQASTKACFYV